MKITREELISSGFNRTALVGRGFSSPEYLFRLLLYEHPPSSGFFSISTLDGEHISYGEVQQTDGVMAVIEVGCFFDPPK